jgi:hypothetical protein
MMIERTAFLAADFFRTSSRSFLSLRRTLAAPLRDTVYRLLISRLLSRAFNITVAAKNNFATRIDIIGSHTLPPTPTRRERSSTTPSLL